MEFYASCAMGFEPYLAGELRSFGLKSIRPLMGSVSFQAEDISGAYRACLFSRLASRVYLPLQRIDASTAESLYEEAYSFNWEDHISPQSSIAIDARGGNDALRNPNFAALKLKDAIVDRLRDKRGARPSVDAKHADIRISLVIRKQKASLSLDLSGGSLHRREYREDGRQGIAPLKENLASCILAAAEWHKLCAVEQYVCVDPMCGSGTLVIEAALQALDRAPGLIRSHWGFDRWLGHCEELWNKLLDEADERSELAEHRELKIFASDKDPAALSLAQHYAQRAQVASHIHFECADLSQLSLPQEFRESSQGLLVTNPPYAERMGSQAQLPALYAALSSCFTQLPSDWTLALITPDDMVDISLARTADVTTTVMNGPIESKIRIYKPQADELVSGELPKREEGLQLALEQSEQFVARLKKVYKQRSKWAKKQRISAYRLYDADLPDYNVSLDVLEGAQKDEGKCYVQLSEYQAPKHIPQELTSKRLHDVLVSVPQILGIAPDQLICKTRKKSRGGSQYGKDPKAHELKLITQEHGLFYSLNLTQYLDYGLFLDHRKTRKYLAELAAGKRFLNLFAYTGSASCVAAAAGARETTTVDLSKTYLGWAQENMRLNGFRANFDESSRHKLIVADCMQWIRDMRKTKFRWDLIFCDPPSFSNSAKMSKSSFDVQRDHLDLMIGVARLLTQEGVAIFSCNLRSFRPDYVALEQAGVSIENITAQTIDEDFSRNQKIHHCFIIRRMPREGSESRDGNKSHG